MIRLEQSQLLSEKKVLIILLVCIFLFPCVVWYATSLSLSSKQSSSRCIQESCLALQKIAKEQELNRLIIQAYKNKEPMYLQKYLEPLPLLEEELKDIENNPLYTCLPLNKEQRNRLSFLHSKENKFAFVEGRVLQTPLMKETLESQNKPVELDQNDFKNVLFLLEGALPTQENIPQSLLSIVEKRPLLITESAELERKKKTDREIWQVKIKLLKRVF